MFNHNSYEKAVWSKEPPIHRYQLIQSLKGSVAEHPEDCKKLFVWFASVAIYTSNAIEDTGLPIENTRKIVVRVLENLENTIESLSDGQSNLDGLRDVLNHAEAFKYLCCDNLGKQLSVELILNTHEILMKNVKKREDGVNITAGQFRKTDITVGRSGQPCVYPKDVPRLINEMVEIYNYEKERKVTDPYVLSAWLKYVFVHIHPFDDGNGRLSRLLMNWSLLSLGFPFPISLLSGFSYKAKKNYLRCIATCPILNTHNLNASLYELPVYLNTLVIESASSHICSFYEYVRFKFKSKDPVPDLRYSRLPWDKNKETLPELLQVKWKDLMDQFKMLEVDQEKEDSYKLEKAFLLISHSKQGGLAQISRLKSAVKSIISGEEIEEIEDEILTNDSRKRTQREVINVAKAYRYLSERLSEELSVDLIKSVHSIMIPGSEGLRQSDVFIGGHLFPPFDCLDSSLSCLVDKYNQKKKQNPEPILLSTWLMYEILALHPFTDGNGRLSRLLANWSLLSFNIPFPVTFSPEKGASKGHKHLIQAIQYDRLNGGIPGSLATRFLLSLVNGLEWFIKN